MKVIFGSDEKTNLTDSIQTWLHEHGDSVELLGHLVDEDAKWKWVEVGRSVGEKVASGSAEFGIVCCTSGTGVTIAANRVRGARAALCWDHETAKLARKWDNANILALSLRFTSEAVAKDILKAFFETEFDEEGLNEAHKLDQ